MSKLSRLLNKAKSAQPVIPKAKAHKREGAVMLKERPVAKVTSKADKPRKTKPLGEPLVSTATKSCLTCALYTKCHDERKTGRFLCTRFAPRVLTIADVKGGASVEGEAKAALRAFDRRLIEGPVYLSDKAAAKAERSLEKMLNDALESSGVMPADARIDDRDLPTAPNFFSWITEDRFAGNLIKPWAKQIEYPTKLYSEWCPNCTNMKWWNNVPVDALPDDFSDNVQFLEFGVCPRCHTPKSEFIADGLLNPYNELAGRAGQRSSKTFSVMLMVTYDTHRLLKSQNPQAMYGLPSSQMLAGTFSATTFAQAKGNMWDVLQPMLNTANWFEQYHQMLDSTGARIGQELYAIKDSFARYRHRNLTLAISGPNPGTQRGLTRVMVAIDEIGYLKTGKTKSGATFALTDAEGVHDALGRSLLTVRDGAYNALMSGNENVPMGYMFCVSSPSSQTDMIMRLYARSKNSKLIFGYFGATWEMNPKIKKDSPIIAEAYRVNYSNAHRDYGAVPPISGSPFLRMPSLRETFNPKRYNAGELKVRLITNKSGGEQTSGRVRFFKDYSGGPCVVSLDSGFNNNSFSIAVTEARGNGKATLRFLGELLLTKDAPLHFPAVIRDVVVPVIQHFGATLLVSDRWQSINMLQQMEEDEGVTSLAHTLKYPDFSRFRQEGIYDGKLKMPSLELSPKEAMKVSRKPGYPGPFAGFPMSHLLYQLVAVQDLPGQTVNKPEGGTDDNFRAVVLGWHAATDPTFAEFLHEPDDSRPIRALGAMSRGRTSGATGAIVNSIGVKRSVGMGGGSSGGSSGLGTLRRGI